MAGWGARGSDDVKRYVYYKMAWRGQRGSRWLGLSHMVRYDLKVVLILLDSWEGARGSEDVKSVRILLDG